MEIIRTKHPDIQQLRDMHSLEAACQRHDHMKLTFPTEEECLSYLLYDKSTLLSAASAFFYQNGIYCCSAFTQPSARKRGFFTMLLKELLKEYGECDFIFLADDACPDTRHTLKALDAELLTREHGMAISFSACQTDCADCDVDFFPSIHDSSKDTRYTIIEKGDCIGSFHLIFQNGAVCFYGFEIHEHLRHQGAGTRAMSALLNNLAHMATGRPSRMLLQVSDDNRPALTLYKKLGFDCSETLSYYIY